MSTAVLETPVVISDPTVSGTVTQLIVPTSKQRFALLLTAKSAVVDKSKVAADALQRFAHYIHMDTPLRYIQRTFGWLFRKLSWVNPLALVLPLVVTETGQKIIKSVYKVVTAPIRLAAKYSVKAVKWVFGLFGAWGGRVNAKIDRARAWYHKTKAAFFQSGFMKTVKRLTNPKGTLMTVLRGGAASLLIQSFLAGPVGLSANMSRLGWLAMIPALRKIAEVTNIASRTKSFVKNQQAKANLAEVVDLTKKENVPELIAELEQMFEDNDVSLKVTSLEMNPETNETTMVLADEVQSLKAVFDEDGQATITDLQTGDVLVVDDEAGELVTPLTAADSAAAAPRIAPVTGVNTGAVTRAAKQASEARRRNEDKARRLAEAKRKSQQPTAVVSPVTP